MVRVDDVRKDEVVRTYIHKADAVMDAIGYTEHGMRHVLLVSDNASRALKELGADPRRAELAAIAGLLHDLGNVAGRKNHEQVGAIIAHRLLTDMGMSVDEACDVMAAIGNHEADPAIMPALDLCGALVVADKADVHHTRVRPSASYKDDIHDRVNGAAQNSRLDINAEDRVISLAIRIDPDKASPMEYFEIFLGRMVMSRRAAEILECRFELYINEARLA